LYEFGNIEIVNIVTIWSHYCTNHRKINTTMLPVF